MNELQNWLDTPDRDYAEGVALFARYCKNKALVRYFQTGTARFRMGKLVYEMGKLAKTGVVMKTVSQPPVETRRVSSLQQRAPQQHRATVSPATAGAQLPPFILAAKKEISSLYALIDKRHRELYDLGTSNADDVVRRRKRILDDRKPAIERADCLYQLKEEWFALEDGSARERVAKEIREMLAAPLNEQPTITGSSASSQMQTDQLRDAVASLTDLQLSKRRTQLRSSITKTQNMLQYQTIRKGNTPAPMPPGPKRDEYQKKLKALKTEFKAVTDELARRAAN